MQPYDVESIAERLEEAAETLRRIQIRDERIAFNHLRSSMPTPAPPGKGTYEWWLAYGRHELTEVRPSPPPGRAIDQMDEALGWLGLIDIPDDHDQTLRIRRVVWTRATGLEFAEIGRRMGFSRTWASQLYRFGLDLIQARLARRGRPRLDHALRVNPPARRT